MSEGMVEAKLIALLVAIESKQTEESRKLRNEQLELIRKELENLGLGGDTKKDPPKDQAPKDKKEEEKKKDAKKLSQNRFYLDNVLTGREQERCFAEPELTSHDFRRWLTVNSRRNMASADRN